MIGYSKVTGTFFKCCYCQQTAERHSHNQRVCDRPTCRKRQRLAQNHRRATSKRKVRQNNGKYGRPIIAPLPAPRCSCGEILKFGSDPLVGTSVQWCSRCGERPLTRYGEVRYDQRDRVARQLERLP